MGESHFAPRSCGRWVGRCYKHPAPTELNGRETRVICYEAAKAKLRCNATENSEARD